MLKSIFYIMVLLIARYSHDKQWAEKMASTFVVLCLLKVLVSVKVIEVAVLP